MLDNLPEKQLVIVADLGAMEIIEPVDDPSQALLLRIVRLEACRPLPRPHAYLLNFT